MVDPLATVRHYVATDPTVLTANRGPSRIVHYYPRALSSSGVTVALWAWARAAARAGVEVVVLHAGGQRTSQRFDLSDSGGPLVRDVEIPHRGNRRMTTHPVGLGRYLGRDDLLVLHEGWVPSIHVAAAAARRARVPYVVVPHGVYEQAWRSYFKPPVRVREWFERGLLDEALAVHVFFDSEVADIRAIAPHATFLTIPTGYQVPHERWAGGGGYLSCIGRYDPINKGLDLLVKAVGSLPPDERPTIRMHGYDFNGGLAVLMRLISEEGLGGWVQVLGVIGGSEKLTFLREADGYVHPARWESQGIAIMENLALGVPCLISDAIEIAATLRDARAAVLEPPTVESLADGLRRLPIEGPAAGARARVLIAERFSWDDLIVAYLSAVGDLMAGT